MQKPQPLIFEEGLFNAKLMCSMRVNLILPKNNKSRRYQKRINEDYLKGVKIRVKPLAKIVQAKKGYTQWIRNFERNDN